MKNIIAGLCILIICMSGSILVYEGFSSLGNGGTYSPILKKITVYPKEGSMHDVDLIYYHERCHLYWHKFMTKGQRNYYETVTENINYYPTKYSQKNVKEDFADSCMLYLYGAKQLLGHERLQIIKSLNMEGLAHLTNGYEVLEVRR